ncbi:hypothetical protein CHISP_3209 [Chitinispirillum alkaliphilum]|nr:hypothetical protein CHISP_3209 [Chitinispirillum alkaliphilum]
MKKADRTTPRSERGSGQSGVQNRPYAHKLPEESELKQ